MKRSFPQPRMDKIVVIAGPTSSGKTALAIRVAKRFNGEIISADSRQVYRGMDLGTGKTPKDTNSERKIQMSKSGKKTHGGKTYMSEGIPHHGIDVASPKRQYTVTQFQRIALKAIADIRQRGKLPIICGGTAHYIDAVVFGQRFPSVPPNAALRKKLFPLSPPELFRMLQKLDPRRAGNIDRHNPRRLSRAIEIVLATRKPVPLRIASGTFAAPGAALAETVDVLWLGINPSRALLKKRILSRLHTRLKQGMVAEIRRLRRQGVSARRLEAFGLEYRYVGRYIKGELTKSDMVDQLYRAIVRFSKRQMTWWKRNSGLQWIRTAREGMHLVSRFLDERH